ncbi:SRPBCC domain-containing protein [Halalkalibaculum sp. DA3122]|uniref:SRPBCC family protein n=1 Tax=Halalkalibaculum sp. DA3122 TaxID=3373607 RepID=UPI003753EF96
MNNLTTNFTVDKKNNIVKVKRAFAAPRDNVWAAWTEPELLDQWWAPKPWKSETKSMDFSAGGQRLYAMVGPEGEKHWSRVDYTSITPKTNIKLRDGFCDSKGNINQDLPQSDWNIEFSESDGLTIVEVEIKHETLADLEQILEMGFQEGFTATLEELDQILTAKK